MVRGARGVGRVCEMCLACGGAGQGRRCGV